MLTGIVLVVRTLCLLLLLITTAYVVLYGKKNTGIKMDYAFTAIFLIVTAWVV